jgi:signal transduction histidine kinase
VRRRLGHAALAVLAWTAVGCVFALPAVGRPFWRQSLAVSVAQWWSWGLLAPLIIAVDRRLPFSSTQLVRRVLVQIVLGVFVTAGYVYVFAAARALLGVGGWGALRHTDLLAGALRGMFLWGCVVYWLIVGVWQAYHYSQRYLSSELRMERLERQFAEARLNALRMQLDPHFLFNALNTISSQVERDPRLARGMIEDLGNLLRLSLENRDKQQIPLVEEMAFLDHYLAIQKIRFGDHLKVELRIAPEVKFASVPCLFIQPLVENAIRHGISRRAAGGTVSVSAERSGNRLEIHVLDDGVGLPPGWSLETSSGLGLSVTRARVESLHQDGSSHLTVERRAAGGTDVRVSLPLRFNGECPDEPALARSDTRAGRR